MTIKLHNVTVLKDELTNPPVITGMELSFVFDVNGNDTKKFSLWLTSEDKPITLITRLTHLINNILTEFSGSL
jgi:hypothetical protein